MALDIKYCIKVDPLCKELIIEDITGDYSVDNPGGYGAPNPLKSEITDIFIDVITSGGTYPLSGGGILPDSNLSTALTDLGLTSESNELIGIEATTTIDDGSVYDVVTEMQVFIYCGVTQVVKNLFAQLATPGCCDDCLSERQCIVTQVHNFYLSLEFAASTGNSTKFVKLLEAINVYKDANICGC